MQLSISSQSQASTEISTPSHSTNDVYIREIVVTDSDSRSILDDFDSSSWKHEINHDDGDFGVESSKQQQFLESKSHSNNVIVLDLCEEDEISVKTEPVDSSYFLHKSVDDQIENELVESLDEEIRIEETGLEERRVDGPVSLRNSQGRWVDELSEEDENVKMERDNENNVNSRKQSFAYLMFGWR